MKIPKPEKHTIDDEIGALKHLLENLKRKNCTEGWIYVATLIKLNKLEKQKYGAIK